MPKNTAIAACTFDLAQSGQGAIQLFPAGRFDAPRGALQGAGPWNLDQAAATALIAKTAQRQNPLVVDYEHQTLLASKNGQPAPAAGWVAAASLEWRGDGGLWATVEWTDRAAAHIAAKEYCYISPVFSYDRKTGRPVELLSAALTNNPAIDGMAAAAVAAATAALSTATTEMPAMDMSEIIDRICYMLNLPITSTPEEIAGHLDKLKAMIATAPAEAAATGLFGLLDAKDAEIAALKSAAPDPAQFAPVAAMQALQTEVAALRAESVGRRVEELVCAALSDGRLVKAQETWARGLGQKDLAQLQAYFDSTPGIAALTSTQTSGNTLPANGGAALSDTQLAVCTQMGVDPEAFKAELAKSSS